MSDVTLNPLECALDEAQALRGQVDALEAENAKLKQELEAVGTAAYLYGRNDLKAENAKLRERVAKLEELTDGKRYIPQEWYQLVTTENAKLRELLLDYDKMLAIAANELAYKSRGLRMDSVLNALRIRMYELGIEVS